MIETEYHRWGLLRSKLAFFGAELPPRDGCHFILCEDFNKKIPPLSFFTQKEKPTAIIDLAKDTDILMRKMRRNRRRVITRGLKMGYQITHEAVTADLLKEFRLCYNRSIGHKGATPIFNLNSFKALIPHMTAFHGQYAGRTLETILLLHDNHTVKGFYKAQHENYNGDKIHYHIGSVLQWEILLHFKSLGYQTYNFGSLALSPAIQQYKLSFGSDLITAYSYEGALTSVARVMRQAMRFMERKTRQYWPRDLSRPLSEGKGGRAFALDILPTPVKSRCQVRFGGT